MIDLGSRCGPCCYSAWSPCAPIHLLQWGSEWRKRRGEPDLWHLLLFICSLAGGNTPCKMCLVAQGTNSLLVGRWGADAVGGNAAAAATRHLDQSEINNLVKSQDRAGAREGAPGETSTTTRAEKKRKPLLFARAVWFPTDLCALLLAAKSNQTKTRWARCPRRRLAE